ncbi:MAG: GNAT family N-acetyltransferase [Rhodospirillales bacterium]|nr:GNAT family N-acetyltransferase [Rhodospirillales bacterium]
MKIDVTAFAALEDMPAEIAGLFANAEVFSTRWWWHSTIAAGMAPDATPRFMLASANGHALALFAMQQRQRGAVLESLTTPYSCRYAPLLRNGLDEPALRGIGAAFAGAWRRWPSVRIDALPDDLPGLPALRAGFREGGLTVAPFDHFGNWHENVAGLTWAAYLAARPGELRETVRRRLRRTDRDGDIGWTLVTGGADLEAGIAEYEDVYARSWKTPEPFPRFNAVLMRAAAAVGALRLGILRQGGRAVAAQLWVVHEGCVTVLKLAHDESFRALSPGTLLTALMIRRLLEAEHVEELDFGRGDDEYKRLWVGRRRQRIGLLLINPRRLRGLALLGRAWLGGARRRLRA